MGRGDTVLNAVIGAIITAITAGFIPLSPVIGGAVAGYLQQEDATTAVKLGTLSGVIAILPFLFITPLLGTLVGLPLLSIFTEGLGAFIGVFMVFLIGVVLAAAVYLIGLGAIGGYLGWYLESETDL